MSGEEEQVHNSLYFGYVIISCLMFECFLNLIHIWSGGGS